MLSDIYKILRTLSCLILISAHDSVILQWMDKWLRNADASITFSLVTWQVGKLALKRKLRGNEKKEKRKVMCCTAGTGGGGRWRKVLGYKWRRKETWLGVVNTQHSVQTMCVESCTLNLHSYGVHWGNQCHPNKFNKKEKNSGLLRIRLYKWWEGKLD